MTQLTHYSILIRNYFEFSCFIWKILIILFSWRLIHLFIKCR